LGGEFFRAATVKMYTSHRMNINKVYTKTCHWQQFWTKDNYPSEPND